MTIGQFIGNFQLDDVLTFAFLRRGEDGTQGWATEAPAFYDVMELSLTGAAPAVIFNNGAMTHRSVQVSELYCPSGTLETLSTANGYEEGRTYVVVVKSDNDAIPTLASMMHFRIDVQKSIVDDTQLLFDVETTDSAAETKANSTIGRLQTLERNHEDVIFPRTKRLLGLLGEHQLVDGYLYDDDGNPTTLRIRIFDTLANKDAASIWRDRQNDADPTAGSLETGEIARYSSVITSLLPRNLRTTYQQTIDSEQIDNNHTGSVI